MFESTLNKRLCIGTMLVVAIAAMLVVEGWLSCENYFVSAESLPMAGVGLATIAALLAAAGAVELRRLGRARGVSPSLWVMMLAAGAVASEPVWRAWWSLPGGASPVGLLLAGLLLGGLVQGLCRGTEGTLGNLGLLCLSTIYLGLGCYFAVKIRLLNAGSVSLADQIGPLVMFLATVKSSDIGAYLVGRKWGRHKLAPKISPGKTWEGFFGGVAVSIIVSVIFSAIFGIIYWYDAVCFGAIVALAGVFGDLFESMLKRDASIKDSANLLPEFGGILDLLDSIVVASPFAYIMFVCFGSPR